MICLTGSTNLSQLYARQIMGRNYLGPEEVAKHYGTSLTKSQIVKLREIPFSDLVLQECRQTHLLVAGTRMTVLDVLRKTSRSSRVFDSDINAWYRDQQFANGAIVATRWYLIRRDLVANSVMKSFMQQWSLLGGNEEVPRVCDLVYGIVLNFLATGDRLFENVYARCSDVDSDGRRVYVGHFDSRGLRINDGFREDDTHPELGIASCKIVC